MRGVEAGGAGLFMTPRNMAKLGYLYLRNGLWENRQVVPAAWVSKSTRRQVDTPMYSAYGYQWWVNSTGGSFSASGFGGQLIAGLSQRRPGGGGRRRHQSVAAQPAARPD